MQTKQVLAVCAGLQVLGRWMQGPDGQKGAGAGLLDLTTAPGPRRAIGEIVTDCTHPGVARLTGFENHRGHTNLGPDSPPLGAVIDGVGNGNGTDGVLTATNIGTYLHGPVLARNPDLADLLLHRATGLALTPLHVPGQEEARGLRLHRPSRAHRPSRTARGHQATS
ncbi:MAG TPA: hypothetical protein VGN47_02040 [Blastococcus sp.]|nr:hypothetical protein [Blastococcus sp.]